MGDSIQVSQHQGPEPNSMVVKDYTVCQLRSLFHRKQNTDVVFGFKDSSVTYAAHQLIVAVWSPYFAQYFKKSNPLPNIVYLEDTDPEAFYFMLRFFYDDYPEIETCDKALKIYNIAIKYQVSKLIKDMLKFVRNFTPIPRNVLTVLNAALHMHLKSQIRKSSVCIRDHTWEVFDSCPCDDVRCTCLLSSVTPEVVGHILELPELSLESYVTALDWFFDWVVTNFKSEDTSFTECCHDKPCLGKVFKENPELAVFLPKIRFLSLSEGEFVEFCALNQDHFSGSFLTAEEALHIMMNLHRFGICPLPTWMNKDRCALNGALNFCFSEG